jgi:hypothetical protein
VDPKLRVPPFRLEPHPLTAEAEAAAGFAWADADIGTRHRLGGAPDGIREDDFPRCPACAERMTFYGQLDSIGDEIALADAGLVAVFVCFGCFEAAARVVSA